MNTQIINGLEGGRHTSEGPLTLPSSAEASPGLLRNVIDSRIVKVRPMSTPIDQLSRCGGARHCGSMTVEFYSVDTRPTGAALSAAAAGGRGKRLSDGVYSHTLYTDNDLAFSTSETLIVPDVTVIPEGSTEAVPMVLYVISRPDSGGVEVTTVNVPDDESGAPSLPAMAEGTKIIRMGRAASELDVQTAQYQPLPFKSSNHCQIFKMQVEESTFHKIANKEIGWSFSDQEEAAIVDMRMGMEKNFLFGSRARLFDPVKNEHIYLTGGIWQQAGKTRTIDPDKFTENTLLDICRDAFTGNCGSKRKILIAGTGLVDAISRIERVRVSSPAETMVKWGIEFREIRSNFGSLYVVHSEIFDQCGHGGDGMVIDPDYLTKYVHVPFHTEKLDLRRSGTRNTSAVVITEASCLVLRYPKAHMRIVSSSGASISE